tara:strand:- start:136 stop:1110 length:975 start_codon:yes stop_codon:yes gene_type:complete
MSFLDNSGDIILDAVLTDTGRYRLSKGDGSFKITKYAFADDEIDYGKYNSNHLSGSAYYDIEILKTPVLEAFTDNTATMRHKLMSIPRNNLLFLPVILINEGLSVDNTDRGLQLNSVSDEASGMFVVACDSDTEDELFTNAIGDTPGVQTGIMLSATAKTKQFIRVDQGLNTTEISPNFNIDPDLRETRYIVEVDNRLGSIANKTYAAQAFSFLDDDNIATYNFAQGTNETMINVMQPVTESTDSPIQGPRGTMFMFAILPSLELQTSDFLFTKLGTKGNQFGTTSQERYRYIDSSVRVTGGTTGYRIDIPIRFVKKCATTACA